MLQEYKSYEKINMMTDSLKEKYCERETLLMMLNLLQKRSAPVSCFLSDKKVTTTLQSLRACIVQLLRKRDSTIYNV